MAKTTSWFIVVGGLRPELCFSSLYRSLQPPGFFSLALVARVLALLQTLQKVTK